MLKPSLPPLLLALVLAVSAGGANAAGQVRALLVDAEAGAGSEARSGALRYGGALGDGGPCRVCGQYHDVADTGNEAGVADRQQVGRAVLVKLALLF